MLIEESGRSDIQQGGQTAANIPNRHTSQHPGREHGSVGPNGPRGGHRTAQGLLGEAAQRSYPVAQPKTDPSVPPRHRDRLRAPDSHTGSGASCQKGPLRGRAARDSTEAGHPSSAAPGETAGRPESQDLQVDPGGGVMSSHVCTLI